MPVAITNHHLNLRTRSSRLSRPRLPGSILLALVLVESWTGGCETSNYVAPTTIVDAGWDAGPELFDPGQLDQCVIYVKPDGSPDSFGMTWVTAVDHVQTAVDLARLAVDQDERFLECEVWVAGGTYHVWLDENHTSLVMAENVHLYGGFTGVETLREQRDPKANETVLERGFYACRHVIIGADQATLDGFTVSNNQSSSAMVDYGGGMYNYEASPTVRNCVFRDNNVRDSGGAIYNSVSAARIERCVFENNYAEEWGGAIYNRRSSPIIESCRFEGNTGNYGGGAIHNQYNSYPHIENCVFYANVGPAMVSFQESYSTVRHCTFHANLDGAMRFYDSNGKIANSILWGNGSEFVTGLLSISPTHLVASIIELDMDNEEVINQDPLFADPENGDLHLTEGSPAVNAGDPIEGLSLDFDGKPRDAAPDIGAYEL